MAGPFFWVGFFGGVHCLGLGSGRNQGRPFRTHSSLHGRYTGMDECRVRLDAGSDRVHGESGKAPTQLWPPRSKKAHPNKKFQPPKKRKKKALNERLLDHKLATIQAQA